MNTGSNSSRSWPQTASSTNANMHILKECIDGWINTDLLSSINPMGKCIRQTCKIFLFCRASRLMGPWFTTVVIFLRVYYKPGAMNTHWFTSLDLLLSFWMFLGIVSRIVSVRSHTIFISPNLLLVFTREIVYRWHTHGSAAKLTSDHTADLEPSSLWARDRPLRLVLCWQRLTPLPFPMKPCDPPPSTPHIVVSSSYFKNTLWLVR